MDKQKKEELSKELSNIWEEFHSGYVENNSSLQQVENSLDEMEKRVAAFPDFIERTHETFERQTSLTRSDVGFLTFAIVLQSAKQVLLNLYKTRLDDKEAAKKTIGHHEEHSNRSERRYYASIEEIKSNPVPFDCVQKEEVVKRNDNPKLSGMNHRYKAIGHDPYLGLIFGTANIMTSTITLTKGKFQISSYHVHSGSNISRAGTVYKIDKLSARASTILIFEKIRERLQTDKKEGFQALAHALWKECVHLMSDIRTKKSLPIPLMGLVSPDFARILGFFEIDYLTVKIVEAEYAFSAFIDLTVYLLYCFCYNAEKDISPELYRVRCLKILQYSNEIATTSSAIQTWVRMAYGDITSAKFFDLGGAINTLYRTFSTPVKIAEIQHEYLLSKGINYLKLK